jgi:hypothetical protein
LSGVTTTHEIAVEIETFSKNAAAGRASGPTALDPGNRIPFHWPPHPVSYEFHLHPSAWTETATLEAYGETFDVEVARTPYGVFGRVESLWHEDRGDTYEEMMVNLRGSAEPLFRRQLAIHETLGRPGRFNGHLRDLPLNDLIKLLYCADRDVAHEAKLEIEAKARHPQVFPALLAILRDRHHPYRRVAQWCVLDMFEALPTFVPSEADLKRAAEAIRTLMWDAEDDHARTMYKAGVVLGGHLAHHHGGEVLLECLKAPSRYARRSAIHGLYHVAEWRPEHRANIVEALRAHAGRETEPNLAIYARQMADDIEAEEMDHVADVFFADEPTARRR